MVRVLTYIHILYALSGKSQLGVLTLLPKNPIISLKHLAYGTYTQTRSTIMTEKVLSDMEKPSLDEHHVELTGNDLWTDPRITAFTVEEQKKIVWRIDRRLVVTLGLLYMISLLDRTNLGAANIAGYAQ